MVALKIDAAFNHLNTLYTLNILLLTEIIQKNRKEKREN